MNKIQKKQSPCEGVCSTKFLPHFHPVKTLMHFISHEKSLVLSNKDSCTCPICRSMCQRRPCWSTPEDAKNLISKGYGNCLMLDHYYDRDAVDQHEFDILTPAVAGYEQQHAPFGLVGVCTFFKDERCKLHNLGLKPKEGREVWCRQSGDKANAIHHHIGMLWNNAGAQSIIDLWNNTYKASCC